MRKEVENPRYANNSDTRIEYDAVYYDNEGIRVKRNSVSVNKGSKEFEKIQREFGEEQLQTNKHKALGEIEERREQIRFIKNEKEKKDAQAELFQLKSYLFGTKLVHETASKELRRKIRKAQTLEETRMITNVLLMEHLFGITVDVEKLTDLLSQVGFDD